MGVDFYPCALCREVFCDAGEYYSCEECGSRFCSYECAAPKPINEEGLEEDDENYNEDVKSCILCRKEEVTNDDLLSFLLQHFSITREHAAKLYRTNSTKN